MSFPFALHPKFPEFLVEWKAPHMKAYLSWLLYPSGRKLCSLFENICHCATPSITDCKFRASATRPPWKYVLEIEKICGKHFSCFLLYFVFCYMPRSLVAKEDAVSSAAEVNILSVKLVFLNSSLNPMLYCWRILELRREIKHKFCC